MALLKKLWKYVLAFLALLGFLLRLLLGKNKPPPSNCHCVCPPALKKPDPFLYSQFYLLSQGKPVVWSNRDIHIFQGMVLVDPDDLQAGITYTVAATIWNGSPDVPVPDLKVNFSYLSFGMGVQSNAIGATTTDLGVKGLPASGCPAFAYMPWTTPSAPGHYCIQVLLEPPDDYNWLNNLGQLNTHVAQAQSPAIFKFLVGNHVGPRTRPVHFTTDTYTIPPLPRCEDVAKNAGRPRVVSDYAPPVPEGWTVALTPADLQLAAGEEQEVIAEITPPDGFVGTMPFNVTGWDNNGPVGGVTLIVEVS
jgi:hypothetical protein